MVTDDDEASQEGHDEERAPPLYRNKRTARFANGERVREFQAFEEQAKKRLLILRAGVSRQGLMLLPSNRSEAPWRPQGAVQHPHQSAVAHLLRVAGALITAIQYRNC